MDPRLNDIHPDRVANIERISVVSTLGVAIRIIDGNIGKRNVIRLDTKRHKGGVFDV